MVEVIGSRVRLRPIEQRDQSALADVRQDLDIQRAVMSRPRLSGPEPVGDWLSRVRSDERRSVLAIADRQSDAFLGYVDVSDIDLISRRASVGICIAAAQQGKGNGTEALELLHGHLAEVWGVQKTTLEVLADNEAARSLYQRVGYGEVGKRRRHFYWDGQWHDVVIMERIESFLIQ